MATTKIDHFGRVVIPKPIRDNLGLEPGTRVEVMEEAGRVVLKSTDDEAHLAVKDGILVFTGGRATGDMTDIIRKVREQRDRQVLGMDDS
ncbi:MAG TPA: AbrB/MazE/SpoVT family DNA-binding domain-containing protein [Planctomycetota bacterium]|nr:AbrB/MazE/SpoVT family DNA-binding domain-containing protein [Planctomycetota bacterium]